ncbi:hypothetical protein [Amycolatopsis sp. H20-H5]|uniref:hypothetical protein n=1 Tax=Amycolatopsis sp. H20-H5 TaxID=3046309 RepID=UPI002DC064EA|nr:hypothetical protein [Amycolatopsis sp. H20-H5]MEC3974362.1 hypothetical protein [Amycolatopsis sp. H20-H5]
MDNRPPQVAHAASGIISLLILATTILVLSPIPPFGSPEAEIVQFYATHTTSGYIYQFIAGLALMAVLWFLGYLYTRFRREVPDSPLPVLMIAAGTAWVGFAVVYLGLFQIFSGWAADPATHSLLRAFSDAYVLGFMFSAIPAAVVVISAALCTRRSAGWPGWLRPLAAVVVLVQLLGCVPLLVPDGPLKAGGPITYASVFAVVIWVAMASIAAIRSERAKPGQDREKAYSEA